jgi:hypothetical protein
LNGDVSPIGKYIAEDISINLSDKFHITNRNQLNTILKENKLSSEGFINQATLKQVKKLSDIDIIITGTVTVLSENIKITLQALDADGNIVAATKGEVPMNADVKELLGINAGSSNRGFNHSLNSNEQLNNPKTVNSDCETNNTGDYCISNNKNFMISFKYSKVGSVSFRAGGDFKLITIEPGQTSCLYELSCGVWNYKYEDPNNRVHNVSVTYGVNHPHGQDDTVPATFTGQFKVEKCTSKTMVIK